MEIMDLQKTKICFGSSHLWSFVILSSMLAQLTGLNVSPAGRCNVKLCDTFVRACTANRHKRVTCSKMLGTELFNWIYCRTVRCLTRSSDGGKLTSWDFHNILRSYLHISRSPIRLHLGLPPLIKYILILYVNRETCTAVSFSTEKGLKMTSWASAVYQIARAVYS